MIGFIRPSRRALLLAGAAAAFAAGAAANMESESARLARVFADSDEEQLKLVPLSATWRGDMRYADQFGDLITDEYMNAFRAYAERDLARIIAIDRSALSPADRMLYDVFRYQTEFALDSYRSGAAQTIAQDLALDHLNGVHMSFPQAMAAGAQYPYDSVERYESALKLHDGFVLYLDRAIEFMRRGIARGNVHVRFIVERVIGQLREIIAAGVDGSPFLTPTRSFPAGIGPADRNRLTAAYRRSIAEKIVPVHRRLLAFFEREYLPRSRTGAPGLAGLPSGATLYAYFLELFTTTRMKPDDVFALGEKEVARIKTEMERVMAQVGFQGTLQDFFTHIRTDPRFKFATKEAYIAGFREIWDRVRPLLPRYFETIPALPFEIRPVPAEMETATGGAYYVPGTPDGARPGIFYANTSNLPARTSPIMTALFLHEAIPGHHFQGALAMEDNTLPPFLRFLWNAGYGEGWALYAERLGIEMGLYADPYKYFGMLDLEMFRAVRLVIDAGLHAKGWTRERAVEYMSAHTSLDAGTIGLEIDRYVVWPGQATAYKIGEIVIKRLRAHAESKRGARFDLKAFHTQVLNTGAIPLHVLEAKIGRWIETA